jgi:hypothetical protein
MNTKHQIFGKNLSRSDLKNVKGGTVSGSAFFCAGANGRCFSNTDCCNSGPCASTNDAILFCSANRRCIYFDCN